MPEAISNSAGSKFKPFVTSTSRRLCMPEPAVQRKAWLHTTMEPSPLTAVALPPPRPTMPEPAVQRKAWPPVVPTITEPSALTPAAVLFVSPGRWPRPTMPEPAVQRKAWPTEPEELVPTMTEPSALTPLAELFVLPGRWPRPTIPEPAVQRKAWLPEAE